jgi:hypothetical protein
MKQKMTLFTLGGKCGGRGARELGWAAARALPPPMRLVNATSPKPVEQFASMLRREIISAWHLSSWDGSIDIDELFQTKKCLCEILPDAFVSFGFA